MRWALIVVLSVALGFMTYVAWHNATPLCDELIRAKNAYNMNDDLVCELNLGPIQEDQAQVRMRSE